MWGKYHLCLRKALWGHIFFNKCTKYSCESVTKKEMTFYCNSVWPQYTLGSREWWPLNGSLHYYTILHLELFCERTSENDEIPYAEALTPLYQKEKKSDSCCLMVQWFERKTRGRSVLQDKEEESETEDTLFQNLNSPLANLAPPLPEQTALTAVPTTPTSPTYSLLSILPVSPTYRDQTEVSMLTRGAQGPGTVSSSKTGQRTPFG